MTGYQAVLLAGRSGPGHVIRFANAMMCHIRDREGTQYRLLQETIELLCALRPACLTTRRYTAHVETDGHANSGLAACHSSNRAGILLVHQVIDIFHCRRLRFVVAMKGGESETGVGERL